MGQIKIDMDDIVVLTQMMTTVIQRKGLHPDEFKIVRDSWERMVDAVAKMQRNSVIKKLYPEVSDVSLNEEN